MVSAAKVPDGSFQFELQKKLCINDFCGAASTAVNEGDRQTYLL
jgi:hypothetical protein